MKKELNYTSGYVPMGTIVAFVLDKNNIPEDWLPCDGSKIPVKYSRLIQALANDSTPNLCGRTCIGTGTADWNKTYNLWDKGGEEICTLSINEIPSHAHAYYYKDPLGSEHDGYYGGSYWSPGTIHATTDSTGGGEAHNNMQPYFAVNYIIYAGEKDQA